MLCVEIKNNEKASRMEYNVGNQGVVCEGSFIIDTELMNMKRESKMIGDKMISEEQKNNSKSKITFGAETQRKAFL